MNTGKNEAGDDVEKLAEILGEIAKVNLAGQKGKSTSDKECALIEKAKNTFSQKKSKIAIANKFLNTRARDMCIISLRLRQLDIEINESVEL
jgi:hypothetical protein